MAFDKTDGWSTDQRLETDDSNDCFVAGTPAMTIYKDGCAAAFVMGNGKAGSADKTRFIVRACNNHDKLVAMLNRAWKDLLDVPYQHDLRQAILSVLEEVKNPCP